VSRSVSFSDVMGETSCAEETPPYGVNLRPSRHPKKISGASDHSRRFAVASWISVALMAMILLVVYLGDNPRLFRRYRHQTDTSTVEARYQVAARAVGKTLKTVDPELLSR
jgi:hypothetical protein